MAACQTNIFSAALLRVMLLQTTVCSFLHTRGVHWMVPVWHRRMLSQFISLWPHWRRTTIPIKLSHPDVAHEITREGSLVEGFSVLLYTLQLWSNLNKLEDDVILIATSPGWDVALQSPNLIPRAFQKKNYLNHSTITAIPKIVFKTEKKIRQRWGEG